MGGNITYAIKSATSPTGDMSITLAAGIAVLNNRGTDMQQLPPPMTPNRGARNTVFILLKLPNNL